MRNAGSRGATHSNRLIRHNLVLGALERRERPNPTAKENSTYPELAHHHTPSETHAGDPEEPSMPSSRTHIPSFQGLPSVDPEANQDTSPGHLKQGFPCGGHITR